MDTTNIDYKRREAQEMEDYINAVKIFSKIYAKCTIKFEKGEEWSPVDMCYSAWTKSESDICAVEIKSNYQSEEYETFPLKCHKLAALRTARVDPQRLLYLVLYQDREYYIFDLDALDLNQCELRNWRIKKTQYNLGKDEYENAPTFFIPKRLAILNGFYDKERGETETI